MAEEDTAENMSVLTKRVVMVHGEQCFSTHPPFVTMCIRLLKPIHNTRIKAILGSSLFILNLDTCLIEKADYKLAKYRPTSEGVPRICKCSSKDVMQDRAQGGNLNMVSCDWGEGLGARWRAYPGFWRL